jgi:hypothetical protein
MLISATFLPLTLDVLDGERPAGAGPVADAVRRVELDAQVAWASLLDDPDRPVGTGLAVALRRLSPAVGGFVGAEWWDGGGRPHRDRVAGYQLWLEEALVEGDGAGFARAFAGYDEALARAIGARLTAARAPGPHGVADRRDTPGRIPGWAAGITGHRSGTMAGWARQARAVTSRVATGPSWTTSRRGTSSSRWSRRSRSAG